MKKQTVLKATVALTAVAMAGCATKMTTAIASEAPAPTITGTYVDLAQGSAAPVRELDFSRSVTAEIPEGHFIALYPNLEFQTIEGVGGAFNENGGEALGTLPAAERAKVMEALFGAEGAAFTFNRLPVAATDFSLDAYSYSMVAEDFSLEHFSFDRERKYMVPYVKAAYAVNPDMALQSSPWSPPGWMKGSGFMDKNDKYKGTAMLRANPKVYATYADYLARFVKEYAAEGIRVDYLCVQNEPDSYAYFPGCYMEMDQMVELTRDHIRPRFKKEKLDTQLFAGTFRSVGRADHLEILNAGNADVFDGFGFQYAQGIAIKEALLFDPDVKLIHTEGKCHHGENTLAQAKLRLAEVADYINNGVVNYCYWNMILNEESASAWGWKQNSLIKIDRGSGKVIYNPDFNAICLISRTLRPGDVRVGSYSRVPSITVKDADGIIKVLAQNETDKEKVIRIDYAGHSWPVVMPPNALCAFSIQN